MKNPLIEQLPPSKQPEYKNRILDIIESQGVKKYPARTEEDYVNAMVDELRLSESNEQRDKFIKEYAQKLKKEPRSEKFVQETMVDLGKWVVTGLNPQKIKFRDKQMDKIFAPIRWVGQKKAEVEEIGIGFVPFLGGVNDMVSAARGETHSGKKLSPEERYAMATGGLISIGIDFATAGLGSAATGAGRLALREGGEYLAKEGTEMLVKEGTKEAAEYLAKEGTEAATKKLLTEGGDGISRKVFNSIGDWLLEKGGKNGQFMGAQMKKIDQLAEQFPALRRLIDDRMSEVARNKKTIYQAKDVNLENILSKLEIVPDEKETIMLLADYLYRDNKDKEQEITK